MEAHEKGRARAAAPRPAARELLLEAASAVMSERQTIDVPLSDIAARAEVNVALVSYYFGGKDGLLLALAKRDAAMALGELDRLLSLNISPAEKLRRHLAGVIRTFFRYPYLYRLLAALMRDSSEENAREIATFFAEPLARTAKELMEAGIADGTIRPIDPELFYMAALGACEQIFANRSILKFVHGVEELDEALQRRYADVVLEVLMHGYLAPRPA
ncbi:TetR family transcriptional regulator [Parvibaculum sp.]|uniref:TetR family transcriptional regulator n=2 Tax=Parvibaculum sp. TaxID=2024848 RepID=UPI000C61E097|nr:TetR family transcriptional regulator [Parvibaculum sp.]MAV92337.1 TetR family transcriptional regulator [Pseudobdellovibrionaceae bacterium]HAC59931.1 TetR family transcriptional regulator [Rhodobiaceae bacterium]MAU61520.1 TetR family transcriptional regulator [Parvibaculum sp.]MBO6668205.1 TetR family transcriptional regulator [Parvibaculum sp.]MBO6714677.1 TetR family transcriptional regulator [Parvibaculum sp.]